MRGRVGWVQTRLEGGSIVALLKVASWGYGGVYDGDSE